jgi:ArsR family transcriptional regulator, arsenate/arsenite/antimonite-responsive transcriptional repressor
MTSIDTLLSALSHPARRAALRLLAGGDEHCLCELMAKLGVSQSSMSRHMATLKDAGLITDRRDAQWTRYRLVTLNDKALQAIAFTVLAADGAAETNRLSSSGCYERDAA